MRVGFAGSGNMAAAMARGWARAEGGPDTMLFSDAGSGRAMRLAEEVGGEARASLAQLAADSDLIVLAVKPAALERMAPELSDGRAILSVVGGTSLETLRSALPHVPLMRGLPNVAAEVGRGVTCYSAPDGMDKEMTATVVGLLELLGLTLEVEERLLETVTAVSGCSPAYVALFVEALADAGVREGLDARLAQEIVIETFAGTAELLRDRDTLSVRRAVASPGGSTAAGLAALERGAARAVLADAVRASLERMRG
jgi:pyrroline-5-carboxylate reductase